MACSNQFDVYGEPFIDIYKQSLVSNKYFQQSRDNFQQIFHSLVNQSKTQSVFVKDMAYHAEPFISDSLIRAATHTFLIRDPRLSIPSLYKMRPEFTDDQPGFEGQYKLFQRVVEVTGVKPYVIEAESLKTKAEEIVPDYFRWIKHELPDDVLNWPQGSRDDWKGRESWHEEAINSRGFKNNEKRNDYSGMAAKVVNSIQKNTPFYKKLQESVTLT